jgi:hypothetical protein
LITFSDLAMASVNRSAKSSPPIEAITASRGLSYSMAMAAALSLGCASEFSR